MIQHQLDLDFASRLVELLEESAIHGTVPYVAIRAGEMTIDGKFDPAKLVRLLRENVQP